MLTSEVLRKAREVLETRGHCKGILSNPSGHVCALGAIYAAVTGDPFRWAPPDIEDAACNYIVDAADILVERDVSNPCAVVDWNNAKSRRKGQVLAAFARAAELAEADERKAGAP